MYIRWFELNVLITTKLLKKQRYVQPFTHIYQLKLIPPTGKLYELRDKFNSIARGAGQQNISAIVVKETEIVVPEKNIIDKYTSLVTEIFNRQRTIICEIKLLIEARDRLLPKLMNGEIEV